MKRCGINIVIDGKAGTVDRYQTTSEVARKYPAFAAQLKRSDKVAIGMVRLPRERESRRAYKDRNGQWKYATMNDLATAHAESRDERSARQAAVSMYARQAGGRRGIGGATPGRGESRARARPGESSGPGMGMSSETESAADREMGVLKAVYDMFETPMHRRRFIDLVIEAISGNDEGEENGAGP